MDLDLRKVRYFVAVADLLHFGRAADELHIAQPVLSRQIRALEQELGARLFDRDSRSVTLTHAGRHLLDSARPLLAAADATHRRVRDASGPVVLTVGFRAGLLIGATVREFAERQGRLDVRLRRIEWDEQAALVLAGEVDVAYARRPFDDDGLVVTPLFAESRLVALPAGHRLAGAATVRQADLAGERRLHYLDAMPGGHVLRSTEEKLEHVAAGDGVVVVPASAADYYRRRDICYRPVLDAEPDVVFLIHARARTTPLIEAFRSAVSPG